MLARVVVREEQDVVERHIRRVYNVYYTYLRTLIACLADYKYQIAIARVHILI